MVTGPSSFGYNVPYGVPVVKWSLRVIPSTQVSIETKTNFPGCVGFVKKWHQMESFSLK